MCSLLFALFGDGNGCAAEMFVCTSQWHCCHNCEGIEEEAVSPGCGLGILIEFPPTCNSSCSCSWTTMYSHPGYCNHGFFDGYGPRKFSGLRDFEFRLPPHNSSQAISQNQIHQDAALDVLWSMDPFSKDTKVQRDLRQKLMAIWTTHPNPHPGSLPGGGFHNEGGGRSLA